MSKPIKRGNVERPFVSPTTSDAPVADERLPRDEDRPHGRRRSTDDEIDRQPASDDSARLEDETEDRE